MRYPFNKSPFVTSPSGQVRLEGSLKNLMARFQARIGPKKGRIQGHAKIRNTTVKAHLVWQGLGYPLQKPRVISKNGNLDLSGALDDYHVQASADLARPDGVKAKLDLKGRGSLDGFTISHLKANTLEGQVQGQGKIVWSPALQGRVSLKGEGINPGVVRPKWPGEIRFSAKGRMKTRKGQFQASLQSLTVDGKLRKH